MAWLHDEPVTEKHLVPALLHVDAHCLSMVAKQNLRVTVSEGRHDTRYFQTGEPGESCDIDHQPLARESSAELRQLHKAHLSSHVELLLVSNKERPTASPIQRQCLMMKEPVRLIT